MTALVRSGLAVAVAVADADPAARAAAAADVPGIETMADLGQLLAAGLDGIVIATPSALHAVQAVTALENGVAVFCQKPLARDAAEAERVVETARHHDLLLGVDLSYRHLRATAAAKELIVAGRLGDIHTAELVFHNAYGPDKPWFRSRRLAGGGCLIDLGTHLIDLALWLTGGQQVRVQASRMLGGGRTLDGRRPGTGGSGTTRGDAVAGDEVEDVALAQCVIDERISARLACSWNLHAGTDCVFECTLYGTDAAVSIRNVDGSFYDFAAYQHHGTASELLVAAPDEWGPRAICAWATALARGAGFDAGAERLVGLARTLDEIAEVAG